MSKIKLFCLPYAGGSSIVYYKLKKYLNNFIELYPIELAGRGKRFNETLYNNFNEAVNDIYNIIKSEILNSSYAFFGHSMGAKLIYELINKIREENQNEPEHIFISGSYPTHINNREKILHKLPEDEFLIEVYKFGGMPKEFLENKELITIFSPILRSDYKILETHQYNFNKNKYAFDLTVFGGKEDNEVNISELSEWKNYTNRIFSLYEFDGDHFFINYEMKKIANIINKKLIYY